MKKQPGRWVKEWKRRKGAHMTERNVSGSEAKIAITAALLDMGVIISSIDEYDARRDAFRVAGWKDDDKRLRDYEIPGETVWMIAVAARVLLHGGSAVAQ